MNSDPSVLSVMLGSLALAAMTILGLLTFAFLFSWHLRRKTRDSLQIPKQLGEWQKKRPGATSRWLVLEMLFSLTVIAVGIFLIINARWNQILLLLFLMLSVSLIFRRIKIWNLQYTIENLPFRPIRLLTGEDAVRRGKITLAIGLSSFMFCSILAILSVI